MILSEATGVCSWNFITHKKFPFPSLKNLWSFSRKRLSIDRLYTVLANCTKLGKVLPVDLNKMNNIFSLLHVVASFILGNYACIALITKLKVLILDLTSS